ncbi:MAG: ParB N-terminal domain-containing protein, partial [Solirubrobacterales bacterium]
FQIINGHHRCEALQRLGRTSVDAVVWNVDDEQTDILLSTLTRLGGRDNQEKKQSLLTRLAHRIPTRKLARLLPQTLGQIERLIAAVGASWPKAAKSQAFAIPMVFFVDGRQQQGIEAALASAERSSEGQTRAARRAEALTRIATRFLAPPEREPKSSGS